MAPILIPSKGRAGKSATIKNLVEEGIRPIVVVEPQEVEIYEAAYRGTVEIMMLGKDNGGIGFARQSILQYARTKGFDYYWTLDDDINSCFQIIEGKSCKVSFGTCLEGAERELRGIKNLAVGALEYNQFAWSQKKPFSFNSYCEVATFVNIKNTRLVNYRSAVNLKEDRDFVLQSLANGYVSARTSWWAFGAPKNGSNKGGLYDEYKAGLERERVQVFCSFWPGVCTPIIKKDGRCDAKIAWRSFTTQPHFGA